MCSTKDAAKTRLDQLIQSMDRLSAALEKGLDRQFLHAEAQLDTMRLGTGGLSPHVAPRKEQGSVSPGICPTTSQGGRKPDPKE